ncbi:unnamed protein product [Amoebophrya sp. A120]|nr:unnamed protein product [Amoebophrya sp. A120]|eukprot:GSA120T00010731001.1
MFVARRSSRKVFKRRHPSIKHVTRDDRQKQNAREAHLAPACFFVDFLKNPRPAQHSSDALFSIVPAPLRLVSEIAATATRDMPQPRKLLCTTSQNKNGRNLFGKCRRSGLPSCRIKDGNQMQGTRLVAPHVVNEVRIFSQRTNGPGNVAIPSFRRSFSTATPENKSFSDKAAASQQQPTTPMSKLLTIPNILTLTRLGMQPLLVASFYFANEPLLTTALFSISALTDYLDGVAARMLRQSSPFGAWLDPVVDKIVVLSTSCLLIEKFYSPMITIPVLVMASRELLVAGLRELYAISDTDRFFIGSSPFARGIAANAQQQAQVLSGQKTVLEHTTDNSPIVLQPTEGSTNRTSQLSVTRLAKWKTTFQLVSVILLLYVDVLDYRRSSGAGGEGSSRGDDATTTDQRPKTRSSPQRSGDREIETTTRTTRTERVEQRLEQGTGAGTVGVAGALGEGEKAAMKLAGDDEHQTQNSTSSSAAGRPGATVVNQRFLGGTEQPSPAGVTSGGSAPPAPAYMEMRRGTQAATAAVAESGKQHSPSGKKVSVMEEVTTTRVTRVLDNRIEQHSGSNDAGIAGASALAGKSAQILGSSSVVSAGPTSSRQIERTYFPDCLQPHNPNLQILGLLSLWAAAALSTISGGQYARTVFKRVARTI